MPSQIRSGGRTIVTIDDHALFRSDGAPRLTLLRSPGSPEVRCRLLPEPVSHMWFLAVLAPLACPAPRDAADGLGKRHRRWMRCAATSALSEVWIVKGRRLARAPRSAAISTSIAGHSDPARPRHSGSCRNYSGACEQLGKARTSGPCPTKAILPPNTRAHTPTHT